jgi:hypothetical protein
MPAASESAVKGHRADAGPGVEPAAQRDDLGRLMAELEEAEGGEEEGTATVIRHG